MHYKRVHCDPFDFISSLDVNFCMSVVSHRNLCEGGINPLKSSSQWAAPLLVSGGVALSCSKFNRARFLQKLNNFNASVSLTQADTVTRGLLFWNRRILTERHIVTTVLVLFWARTVPDTFLQMWLITYCFGQLVNESDSNLHALITVNYTEEGTAQRFN